MIAPPSEGLALRTISAVKDGLREQPSAVCLIQVVELIRDITVRPEEVSVQHLAGLIEKDLAMMTKVLSVANTLGYNPEGSEISTIAQAIQTVGFQQVRNLAVTLLLVQNAERETNTRECRDVSALAVAGGYCAECIMEQVQSADPGHAFVCTALRSYGRLLLASFLTEQYRQMRSLGGYTAPDSAWRKQFGLTPLELSFEVLGESGLPASILSTLHQFEMPSGPDHVKSPEVELVAACDFATKLSESIFLGGDSGDQFFVKANQMARDYGKCVKLPGKGVGDLMKAVSQKLKALRGLSGLAPFIDRIDFLSAPELRTSAPTSPPPSAVAAAPSGDRKPVMSVFLQGISTLGDMLEKGQSSAKDMLPVAARVLQKGMQLEECWVFLRRQAAGPLHPVYGTGPLFSGLGTAAFLDRAQRSIFSVCFERGEVVLIAQPDEAKIWPFIPHWLRPAAKDRSLLLVPVRNQGGTFAVLLGLTATERISELGGQVRLQLTVLTRLISSASI